MASAQNDPRLMLLQDSGCLDELRKQMIADIDQVRFSPSVAARLNLFQGDTDFSKLRMRVQELVSQRIANMPSADVADVRNLKNVFIALKQEVDEYVHLTCTSLTRPPAHIFLTRSTPRSPSGLELRGPRRSSGRRFDLLLA